MRILLDSSVLIPLITDHGYKLLKVRGDNELYILDLTIYEAENALWKLTRLQKQLKLLDAEKLMRIIPELVKNDVISLLKVTDLDITKVVRATIQEGLTFYDSSYLIAAVVNGLTLAT